MRADRASRHASSGAKRLEPYPSYKPSGVEWLGEVPRHWGVKRLKTSTECRVSNVDKVPSDEELPVRLCNYTDVYYHDHITPDMGLMETTATKDEIFRFGLQVGDVLITKDSEEWSDIAVPALVTKTAPDLVCGYHLAIVRPKRDVLDGSYLLRAFQACAVNQQFQVAASGVTRYGLPNSSIGEAWIPLPPRAEQQVIASFLDRETARIDELVAKKRALIEHLSEKRTALITRTVTRGLPPEAAKAAGFDPHPKLKPSGVEWLGDLPEHWEVKRIAHVAVVVRGASPRPAGDSRYFDGDFIPWITVGELTKDEKVYLEKTETMLTEDGAKISRTIQPDTLVLTNSGATLGVPKILSITGCANDGVVAFERLKKGANKLFLYYYFRSLTENLRDRIKQGSGQPNLNTDIIKALSIPFPSFPEQSAIAHFLDRETEKIDRLVSKVEEAIERLREYRAALITAAVTGKVRVTGERALPSTVAVE